MNTLQPTIFLANFSTTAFPDVKNDSDCPDAISWDIFYSSLHIYIFIISALGIFLNIFVLLVFSLHKKPCTVAEIYLSNLAAADLILVSCLPFWAINIYNNYQWPFGSFMCKVVNLGIKMNNLCSIYFLVLVSIDRYIALVHAMSYGRMRRPKYAKIGCLIVWIFGLILESPVLIFRKVEYIPDYDVTACIIDYPSVEFSQFCDIMLTIISFLIPICIIAYCTLRIIQALSNKSMDRFHTERTEKKATTLILAVLGAFLICWVPFHLISILDVLCRAKVILDCFTSNVVEFCNQIFTYLAFFNSVLNPVLYVLVGKNFRKKMSEVFHQWEIVRPVTSDSTRSHLSSTLKTTV
ncbi:B2 bradykinin receptor [Periophthalmus magnuspinnatus]|uniref:B2 bradykinin receptor n=1 Tax=Periophthalmus magnuspinnatus TaxID=409849 RepID=UPI00145A7795|nr:B2 bradykinin receptor [Periophthalmus magnuspinnatus]